MTSMSTPSAMAATTTVTLPPSVPDLVCTIALVTSSEESKVAPSVSILAIPASVRLMKPRTCDTYRGSPGIVNDPSMA
jgi:hypothetical protein